MLRPASSDSGAAPASRARGALSPATHTTTTPQSPLSLSPIKHVDSPSMMTSAIETEVDDEVVSLRERLDVFTHKAAEFKKGKEKLVRPTLQSPPPVSAPL